jgi:hypothetical protein
VHLLFDIFRGIGAASAVGIRPFLPALVVCAFAAGSVAIHFNHVGFFGFLQQDWFLLVLAVCAILLSVAERRLGGARLASRQGTALLAVASAALGALLFAGLLRQGGYLAWPGLLGGVICALVGVLATRPLFERVRRRLDQGAANALPLFGESGGVVLAALSVVAPPVGVIGLAALVWLLAGSRRRASQKYAGLRILR